MNRSIITTAAALATMVFATTCDAQIVRFGGFGGVRVRAPYVSVNVGPYGAARVGTPYGAYYGYGPVFPYRRAVIGVPVFPPVPPFAVIPPIAVAPVIPAYPVPVPVVSIPVPVVPSVVVAKPAIPIDGYKVLKPSLDGHLGDDLRRAAIRLQYSLSLRHDADVWMQYLDPARIVATIDSGSAPSSLRDLVMNYDGIVSNSSLRPIYAAGGFNDTRELLRVYVDSQPNRTQAVQSQPMQRLTPAMPIDRQVEQTEVPAPIPPPENEQAPSSSNSEDPEAAPTSTPEPPAPNPPGGSLEDAVDL